MQRQSFPLGGGSLAIGYFENLLPDAAYKGGTVKIPVFLKGNGSEKPNATVSVKVNLG